MVVGEGKGEDGGLGGLALGSNHPSGLLYSNRLPPHWLEYRR